MLHATTARVIGFFKTIALFFVCVFGLMLVVDTVLPPISTLMVGRAFSLQHVHRSFVPINRISRNLVNATIAAEDAKFCSHHGVDWESLQNAVEDAADGEESRGASTISMQVAKNLFLWPGRSYLRKTVEIPLAMFLDAIWNKKRLMQTYLNIAEFGQGVFGAEAAARHYFGKSAANLSPREAALLAGTLPSPKRRNPANPSEYLASYADRIQGRANAITASCTR